VRDCQGEHVTVLLVTHEERLAGFGTGLLAEVVLPSWGCQRVVAGGDEELGGSGGKDLVRHVIAIVTSFSGCITGPGRQWPARADTGDQNERRRSRFVVAIW
jgi:putative resolvase